MSMPEFFCFLLISYYLKFLNPNFLFKIFSLLRIFKSEIYMKIIHVPKSVDIDLFFRWEIDVYTTLFIYRKLNSYLCFILCIYIFIYIMFYIIYIYIYI